jgi:hypothetical protein
MKCSEVTNLMQRYLDNDLREREQDEMHEHLRECTSCAEMFDRLNRLSDELVSLPKVVPPVSIVDSILPRLEEIDREKRSAESASFWRRLHKRVPYRTVGGVAAACVLIALMAIQRPWFTSDNSADDMALMNSAENTAPGSGDAGAANAGDASGAALLMKVNDQKGTPMDKSGVSGIMAESGSGMTDSSGSVESVEPTVRAGSLSDGEPAADGGHVPPRSFTEPGADEKSFSGDGASASGVEGQEPAKEESYRFTGEDEQPEFMFNESAMSFMQPLVSPDGRYSVFVEAVEDGEQVVVLDQDGERIYASPLKPAGGVTSLTWDEDSRFVNYTVTEIDPETGDSIVTGYMIEVEARRELRLVDQ